MRPSIALVRDRHSPGDQRDDEDLIGAGAAAVAGTPVTPIAASASLTADPADYLLSPLSGGLLLVAYALVFVVAGAMLVNRRDLT